MKERLGGLLALALGAVLITTGLNSGASGGVGAIVPVCGSVPIGTAPVCPTGIINVTETTTPTPVAGDPTPPSGGWVVTISSSCIDPSTSAPVDQVLHVPNNGNVNSGPLFVYTNEASTTQCQYTYTQTAVTGFTTTYDTTSPFVIPFGGGATNSGVKVGVTNTFVHVSPSTSASSTPVTSVSPSSSSAKLADTGPRTRITTSVYFGVGLVLLGLVMLFGGTRRRSGKRV